MAGRTLILVAGLPGTGKSRLGSLIKASFEGCEEVSIDPIKERLWDETGFDGPAEKAALERRALETYFREIDQALSRSELVLSDYPFSRKQGPTLATLCEKHGATPLTVRLVAELDVLYERQRHRDLDPARHPGHVLTRYHYGEALPRRSAADALLTREEFRRRCTTRGYDTFALGDVLEVDMTDFDAVDRPRIIAWLRARVPG